MRETQVPIGALVAAIGAVLLIVSLFLDWYGEVTGFTIFEFVDLLLLALALATLAALAAAIGLVNAAVRPGHVLAIAALALLVVFSQLVNDPPLVANAGDVDKSTGIWLALAGSALMVAGAVLSTARIAIAVAPRDRTGADHAAPPRPSSPASEDPTIRSEPPRP
jgi:hypothetical protein